MRCAMEVLVESRILEAERKIKEEAEKRAKYQETYLNFKEKLDERIEKAFLDGKHSYTIILKKADFEDVFLEVSLDYSYGWLYWMLLGVNGHDNILFVNEYKEYLEKLCYKVDFKKEVKKAYSATKKSSEWLTYYTFTVSIDPKCFGEVLNLTKS